MEVLVRFHSRPPEGGARVLGNLTRHVVKQTLRLAGAPETSETSVLYVDDTEMRRLNETYRGLPRTTDVLAFAMRESGAPPQEASAPEMLGDIVVSLETARRQAGRLSLRREIARLLVHGALHLLGYEHTGCGAVEKNRMRAMEKKCLAALEAKLLL